MPSGHVYYYASQCMSPAHRLGICFSPNRLSSCAIVRVSVELREPSTFTCCVCLVYSVHCLSASFAFHSIDLHRMRAYRSRSSIRSRRIRERRGSDWGGAWRCDRSGPATSRRQATKHLDPYKSIFVNESRLSVVGNRDPNCCIAFLDIVTLYLDALG